MRPFHPVVLLLLTSIYGHPTEIEEKDIALVSGPNLEKRAVVDSTTCSVLATCPQGGTQIQNIQINANYVDSGRAGSGSCQWRIGNETPPRCRTRLTFSQTDVPVPPTILFNTADLQWSVNRRGGGSCTYRWVFRVQFDINTRTTGSLGYLEGSSTVTEICTGAKDVCIGEEGSGASAPKCKIDLTGCDLPNFRRP